MNLVVSHGSIVRTAPIVKGDEERVVSYRDAEQAVVSYCAATGRIKLGDIPNVDFHPELSRVFHRELSHL